MPQAVAIPLLSAAAPIVGGLIGKAVGPKNSSTTANLPKDLAQPRADTLALMQYLLGMGNGYNPTAKANGVPQSGPTPGGSGLDLPSLFRMLQGHRPPMPGQSDSSPQGGLHGPTPMQPLDSIPAALRPGEYVLTPEMVQMLGGHGALEQMRGQAFGGGLQHYALGGPVLADGNSNLGMNLGQPLGQMNLGQPLGQGPGGPTPNADPQPNMDPMGGLLGPGSNGMSTNAPGQRVENVFGQTGVTSTPLQRQAGQGMSNFLNQPSPLDRTMGLLNPQLGDMFGQGAGVGNTLGGIGQALNGQLQGQNPLNSQMQNMFQQFGMGQGSNPMPQNAQNALGQGLNTDLMSGGIRDMLARIGQAGGAGGSLQGLASGQNVQHGDTGALQRELGFNPNEQLLSALQPRFQQNLALADQAGGRFGTANAYGRSQATNDYNLMASQALQQDLARRAGLAGSLANANVANAGQANQTMLGAGSNIGNQQVDALRAMIQGGQGSGALQQGAAGLMGQAGQQGIQNQMNAGQQQGNFANQGFQNQQNTGNILGGQALQQGNQALNASGQMQQGAATQGQQGLQALLQAFGMGTTGAQQNDVGNARNLGILMNMLGGMQGATLGAPTTTTGSGFNQGANLGGSIGQLLQMFMKQGGGQGAPPSGGAANQGE